MACDSKIYRPLRNTKIYSEMQTEITQRKEGGRRERHTTTQKKRGGGQTDGRTTETETQGEIGKGNGQKATRGGRRCSVLAVYLY